MVLTLPMIGRVHFVKDQNGWMQVSFVFLYWIYGSFSTLYIILLPQYNDGRIPYCIIVSYMFISIMCLLSLIKASLTNPGRIPFASEEAASDTTDWTFCKTCNQKRPNRAHHCRRCKQCVMRMDHHCPWINNCVGEENHFAFCLLLFYAFLLGIYSLSLSIFHFWVWPKCTSCDKEVFYIKHSIWFMYILVILALNMSMLMFIQMSYLHYNIVFDRTTLELMQCPSQLNEKASLKQMFTGYRILCGQGTVLCWPWPCRRRVPLLPHSVKSPV